MKKNVMEGASRSLGGDGIHIFIVKSQGKIAVGRRRSKWVDDIRVDLG